MGKRQKESYRNGGVTLGKSAGWWVADWRDGSTRKRSRLIEARSPEKEARAKLDAFAEAHRAVLKQQTGYTIGALWDLWMQDRQRDGFENAIYLHQWKALEPAFGSRHPDTITKDICRSYAKTRFDLGRAPATVHTELSRLRGCLAWAHGNRLIGPPPALWVPQPGRPRDRVLSPDEAKMLLGAARLSDPHVFVFVVLLFSTGGRHAAILDLTWDRVDFERGVIELDELLPPDPMNKSWRKGRAQVAMSRLAREALTEAHAGRTCDHVVCHGGKRLKSARDGFAAAAERAGLSGVTPHTIRHSVATWLLGKVETGFTAALLGHRDEATTRRVYTHADAEHTREAVRVIDGELAALPELSPKAGRKAGKRAAPGANVSNIDNRTSSET